MENNPDFDGHYKNFAMGILKTHNELRKLHSAPELVLNDELCEEAQRWAQKISKQGHLSYSELPGIGENITQFPKFITPDEIVNYWYGEGVKYDYEAPGWQEGTNYFTQLIWKSTKEIGIGTVSGSQLKSTLIPQSPTESGRTIVNNPEDQIVVVVFYRPSGNNNRPGQYQLNVGRKSSFDENKLLGKNNEVE